MTRINQYNPRMMGTEAEAVKAVLDSGFINDGPVTAQFERTLATYVTRRHGVAVPNCTSAITLALIACGAQPGDDVIVPAFTFIATANAVRLAGCNVIFADVDRNNFCVNAETVAAVRTPRTKFIVAVEVNGRAPYYDRLLPPATCYDEKLTLITDSCEALGSWSRETPTSAAPCGSFGVASCLSFSPNKIITTGQGGMVLTDSFDIYTRLRQLKYQGLDGPGGTACNVVHPTLGFNFKFTDIQAAVGIEQLKVLHDRLAQCRQRDAWYREALSPYVEFPPMARGTTLWMTDILVHDRVGLAAHLRQCEIGVREFWLPLYKQPAHSTRGQFPTTFPVTDDISARGLWLPSSYDITQDEIGRVADCVKEWRMR